MENIFYFRNRSTIVAPDPIILSIIPWFHSFGCLTLICSSANGQTIVFLPKFEENAFLRAIEVKSDDFNIKSYWSIKNYVIF